MFEKRSIVSLRRLSPVLIVFALAAQPALAELDAEAVFERLKGLEGTWNATVEGNEEGEVVGEPVHVFRVSANSSVVMETMFPGGAHEMINMYHLDGDELVMTHYCAAGNQPTMRLDRSGDDADVLSFVFTGGTNLDPAKDVHIHAGRLSFVGDGKLESAWTGYHEGVEAGTTVFHLERAAGD